MAENRYVPEAAMPSYRALGTRVTGHSLAQGQSGR